VRFDHNIPHIPQTFVRTRSALSDDEKAERKRRLNVLNSRRNRGRKRAEVEVFRDQVYDLHDKNYALRAENERLESLVQSASSMVHQFDAK
jgi:acyl carrier protein phosphodiesterase